MPDALSWEFQVSYAAATDIGHRRATNQDAHLEIVASTGNDWLTSGHLFLIADGMGAHAAGEVASQLAVNTVAKGFRHRKTNATPQALERAILDAHSEIRLRGEKNEAYRGMGTTLTALLLHPLGGLVGHVGDSRVYRYRSGILEQLSFDHSLVWEVCRANGIPFDRPPPNIPRNQLTQSLGASPRITVALEGGFPVEIGDRFLLCSDGLTGMVNNQEMTHILGLFAPAVAVETLVNLATLRGGDDNITVTVVEAQQLPPSERASVFRRRRVAWSPWMLVPCLCGVACGVAAWFGAGVAAGILGACAVFSVAVGVTAWATGVELRPWHWASLPHAQCGNGPYTQTHRDDGHELSAKLANIFQELAKVFREELPRKYPDLDRASIAVPPQAESQAAKAAAAVSKKQWHTATAHYCLAINACVETLKQLRAKRV